VTGVQPLAIRVVAAATVGLLGLVGCVPSTTVPSTTVPSTTVPSTGPAVLAENPIVGVPLGGSKTVRFFWRGQTPGKLIFVDICARRSSESGFNPGADCAPLSSLNPNGTPTGSGSVDVGIFRGREPSGDLNWGCFAPSDTAPAGIVKRTTCYVRVTNNSLFNAASVQEVAFTLK